MKTELRSMPLGKSEDAPFALPDDSLVQTFAYIGIRGSGKSSSATLMAEQFTRISLPWIALDPTGVWWGLRAGKDGNPAGGFKNVVVIGGPHGDLPLERTDGEKLAEAIVSANVCAVIDLKYESKTMYRTFVADFCEKLLRLDPPEPRHVFIEEAPEFVPQRPKGRAMQAAHAAVDKLIRLGRNSGYGASLISQRAATIDKDVLSQCENVFAFRSTHNLDRKAFKDWIEGKVFDNVDFTSFLSELASLPSGTAWFWSPQWLSMFKKIAFSRRETFHPGETRSVGVAPKAVSLSSAAEFVERIKRQLVKAAAPKAAAAKKGKDASATPAPPVVHTPDPQVDDLKAKIAVLEMELSAARNFGKRLEADNRALLAKLDAVRIALKPQFDMLSKVFGELDLPGKTSGDGNGAAIDRGSYETWLVKAGRMGLKRYLETLLSEGELSRHALAIKCGIQPGSRTDRRYVSWLKSNGLATIDGDGEAAIIKLKAI